MTQRNNIGIYQSISSTYYIPLYVLIPNVDQISQLLFSHFKATGALECIVVANRFMKAICQCGALVVHVQEALEQTRLPPVTLATASQMNTPGYT